MNPMSQKHCLDTGQDGSDLVSQDFDIHTEDTNVVSFSPSKSKVPEQKRMSISLPMDIAAMLIELAEQQGISQNEAIKKAIGTEWYFRSEGKRGSKILLQTPESQIREIVLR